MVPSRAGRQCSASSAGLIGSSPNGSNPVTRAFIRGLSAVFAMTRHYRAPYPIDRKKPAARSRRGRRVTQPAPHPDHQHAHCPGRQVHDPWARARIATASHQPSARRFRPRLCDRDRAKPGVYRGGSGGRSARRVVGAARRCRAQSQRRARAGAGLGRRRAGPAYAERHRFTYGLRSSSILAALANAIILLVVTGGLAWEAVSVSRTRRRSRAASWPGSRGSAFSSTARRRCSFCAGASAT